jgi:hypothetical protein
MPTKYKPQLDHTSFDWNEIPNRICARLSAVGREILTTLCFFDEHGQVGNSSGKFDDHILREGNFVISEMAGILSKAGAVATDAGFKATNQVIATLEAIKKRPSIIRERPEKVEPEAFGVLCEYYQRNGEAPGVFWFDLAIATSEVGAWPIDDVRIRAAAVDAIEALKCHVRRGRPAKIVNAILAEDLGAIFVRYNPYVGRSSTIGYTEEAECRHRHSDPGRRSRKRARSTI